MHFVTGETNSEGEVPELATLLLGRWAGYIAKMFSLLVLLGAVIVYWVLMSNFLYHSVDYVYGKLGYTVFQYSRADTSCICIPHVAHAVLFFSQYTYQPRIYQ
jgi:sodium-coupled neutral amino acid transporter 9